LNAIPPCTSGSGTPFHASPETSAERTAGCDAGAERHAERRNAGSEHEQRDSDRRSEHEHGRRARVVERRRRQQLVRQGGSDHDERCNDGNGSATPHREA